MSYECLCVLQDEERVPPMSSSALLVKKLNPPGPLGRLSSPLYNARNGALPPIGTLTALELEPHPRYQVSNVQSQDIDRFRVGGVGKGVMGALQA